MIKQSAGICMYRFQHQVLQVLLAHPGGPYWAKKDIGSWTIPKGEIEESEKPVQAALREFNEEIGIEVIGKLILLTPVKQKAGKIIHAWAVEGDPDISDMRSQIFEIEWPPRSGKKALFPEIDKAEWFNIEEARQKIISGQLPLLEELISLLND